MQELQLLEIMCSCFQEQSRDTVRQLMFSALFSLQGNQADESRMALLSKLVSMSVAVGRVPILECAATWLQVRVVPQKSCHTHVHTGTHWHTHAHTGVHSNAESKWCCVCVSRGATGCTA